MTKQTIGGSKDSEAGRAARLRAVPGVAGVAGVARSVGVAGSVGSASPAGPVGTVLEAIESGDEPVITLGPGGDYVRMLVAREVRETLDSEASVELVEMAARRERDCSAEEAARRAAAMHTERLRVQWSEHSRRHGELSAAHHILERQSGAAAGSLALISSMSSAMTSGLSSGSSGGLSRGIQGRPAGSAPGLAAAGPVGGRSGGASAVTLGVQTTQGIQATPAARSPRRRAAAQVRQPTLFAR